MSFCDYFVLELFLSFVLLFVVYLCCSLRLSLFAPGHFAISLFVSVLFRFCSFLSSSSSVVFLDFPWFFRWGRHDFFVGFFLFSFFPCSCPSLLLCLKLLLLVLSSHSLSIFLLFLRYPSTCCRFLLVLTCVVVYSIVSVACSLPGSSLLSSSICLILSLGLPNSFFVSSRLSSLACPPICLSIFLAELVLFSFFSSVFTVCRAFWFVLWCCRSFSCRQKTISTNTRNQPVNMDKRSPSCFRRSCFESTARSPGNRMVNACLTRAGAPVQPPRAASRDEIATWPPKEGLACRTDLLTGVIVPATPEIYSGPYYSHLQQTRHVMLISSERYFAELAAAPLY